MIGAQALRRAIIDRIKQSQAVNNLTLGEFIPRMFPSYKMTWFHLMLCNVLMDWMNGLINRRIMISTPPRHGKSEICSIQLPAYIHGKYPSAKLIECSYSARLANRMTRKVQRVMELGAYKRLFPEVRLATAKDAEIKTQSEFEIVGRGGLHISAGIGGGITGEGLQFGIIDDPIKNRKEANSPTIQDAIYDWYKSTFFTRCEQDAKLCIIQTRWHENDLAGRIIENEPDKWLVINVPARYDPDLVSGIEDQRTTKGEPLWPEMYGDEFLTDVEQTIGLYEFSALYNGNPYTDAGSIFKPGYWQYYDTPPERFLYIEQSWDTALKEGQENDYTVCTTWGVTNTGYYLLHLYKEKVEFPELIDAMKMLAETWKPNSVLIEDKASGTPALQTLKRTTRLPIVPVEPQGEKIVRAKACTGVLSSGRVYLPANAHWTKDFVNELRKFPNGKHDDDTDSTTQFLNRAIRRDGVSSVLDTNKYGR